MNITIEFDWKHIAVPVIGAAFAAGVVLLCQIVAERARSIWGGILGYVASSSLTQWKRELYQLTGKIANV